MFITYFQKYIKKNGFLAYKIFMSIKLSKQEKFGKMFQIYFLCSVKGTRCGIWQKFDADRRIFKQW
jgi:hypothetical protein